MGTSDCGDRDRKAGDEDCQAHERDMVATVDDDFTEASAADDGILRPEPRRRGRRLAVLGRIECERR